MGLEPNHRRVGSPIVASACWGRDSCPCQEAVHPHCPNDPCVDCTLGGAQFPGCLPPPCAKWPCVTWLGGRFLFVLSPFWLGRCRHCLIAFSRLSGLKLHDPAETRAIGLLVSRVLLLRSGAFVFAAFFFSWAARWRWRGGFWATWGRRAVRCGCAAFFRQRVSSPKKIK